ncbi:DUF4433 domain-containing protein [Ktedonospora formicarum]|uniref:DarT domain-containing protein n=1 Tax=Ktedonospora formicarum TaxID=2778364 RepID=A0A8J3MW02_9CHLR|nr:DUF4433 domain-containing protein [Ktedonospora formicarum]GHO50907.1 hypothetical protein KSX_90700 [Ktedonospora formicarum]
MRNFLSGYAYHMVHVSNFPSILSEKALLSNEKLSQKGIKPFSIAWETVQSLRKRITIQRPVMPSRRQLHSYVPFYFIPRPPMFYAPHIQENQNQLLVLEVELTILYEPEVLFTDGNASMQKLSRYGMEVVVIDPASAQRDTCIRRYHPGGPHGTGENWSDFYSDVALIDRLNWGVLNGGTYIDNREEFTRIRSSEVLIPDRLPLSKIVGIYAPNPGLAQKANDVVKMYGLEKVIPKVVYRVFPR